MLYRHKSTEEIMKEKEAARKERYIWLGVGTVILLVAILWRAYNA